MTVIAEKWLSMLRDPVGLAALELDGEELVNRASGRRYPIVESIPVLMDRAELGPQNVKYQGMYDWGCYGYDLIQKVGDVFFRGALARLRRELAARLSLKAGDRVLYTSIGTGLDLPYFAERVALERMELVGLDLSMGMLRRCRARVGAEVAAGRVLVVQANAERLPLADGVFDVVLHVGGINFFDEPAVAVKEMVRVAKGGALILIGDETKDVVVRNYQRNPLTRSYFKDAPVDFQPREWVPEGVGEARYEEVWGGRGYVLTFRAPGG